MNQPIPEALTGYQETWNSYKETDHYKQGTKYLRSKGISQQLIDEILEHAFNAGWSMLISTFIKNISENEKRFNKPAGALR